MKCFVLSLALLAGPAFASCLPSEAGGYGQGFAIVKYEKGVVYSWHCPKTEGGWIGEWLAVHTDRPGQKPPVWPDDRTGRLSELSRLQVIHGYSVDADTFLRGEAITQLAETKPR